MRECGNEEEIKKCREQRENEEMCEFEIQDCAEDLPLGLECAEE